MSGPSRYRMAVTCSSRSGTLALASSKRKSRCWTSRPESIERFLLEQHCATRQVTCSTTAQARTTSSA